MTFQAAGNTELTPELQAAAAAMVKHVQANPMGIPKEVARVVMPAGHYSRMRATANLRNWLAFLKLRCAPGAQWEIRQYANAVAGIVRKQFPRTYGVARESLGLQ